MMALLLLVGACDGNREGETPEPDRPQRAAALALTIDGEFGAIQSVAVDRAGRIYAADVISQEIRVFSPAGDPLPSIGRKGRGPGEFTGLYDVVVARGDSLFAFDPIQQRVSVYAIRDSAALAYTTDVSFRLGKRASYSLLVPSSGGMILQYATPFGNHNLDAHREVVVRVLDHRGALVKDSLLVIPDREFLVTRSPQYGYSVSPLPFGRQPVLRLGADDRLYYGWSDSLAIGIYSLHGRRVGRIGARRPAVRVDEEDLRALSGSYEAAFVRRLLQKARDEGKIPSTRPAFKDFLVDERGAVWVNLLTQDDIQVGGDHGLRYTGAPGRARDRSLWWVFDADGKHATTVTFPRDVTLHVIRGHDAYGVVTDDLGVQRIVRYRIPG